MSTVNSLLFVCHRLQDRHGASRGTAYFVSRASWVRSRQQVVTPSASDPSTWSSKALGGDLNKEVLDEVFQESLVGRCWLVEGCG